MLIINRAVPIAWRSETCVQFGVDDPVLIDGMTHADSTLLRLLRVGLSESEFFERALALGVTDQRARSLLALLTEARVLVPRSFRADDLSYETDALALSLHRDPLDLRDELLASELILAGPFRADLERLAHAAGFRARAVERVDAQLIPTGATVILTAVWAADLLSAGELMTADVDHVLVVFGPERALISHLIVPGSTPCAGCWAAHQVDADDDWLDGWKNLKAQNPSPALVDPLLAAVVLPQVLLRLREKLLLPGWPVESAQVSLRGAEVHTAPAEFHDRCDCLNPQVQLQESVRF